MIHLHNKRLNSNHASQFLRHCFAFLFTTTMQHYLMCRFMKDVHVLGGTPLKTVYGYLRPKRLWFAFSFDLKLSIRFKR